MIFSGHCLKGLVMPFVGRVYREKTGIELNWTFGKRAFILCNNFAHCVVGARCLTRNISACGLSAMSLQTSRTFINVGEEYYEVLP